MRWRPKNVEHWSHDNWLVIVNSPWCTPLFLLPLVHDTEGLLPVLQHDVKEVPMMVRRGIYNVAEIRNPLMTVVELPFDNNELSMLILLPNNKEYPEEVIDFNFFPRGER